MTHAPGWSSIPPIAGSTRPGYPMPPAPPPIPPAGRRSGGVRRAATSAALVACVFGAGVGGVAVGAHLAPRPTTATPLPATSPPPPEVVRAQTINLCTRWAAAYAAIPTPQTRAADVVPATNYVADALRDNPAADTGVRAAMLKSLQELDGIELSFDIGLAAGGEPIDWRGRHVQRISRWRMGGERENVMSQLQHTSPDHFGRRLPRTWMSQDSQSTS